MKSNVNLIWHIGAGKTGTTSIQSTLSQNKQVLESRGVRYIGYMLEGAKVRLYPWQKPSQTEVFHTLNESDTEEALEAILRAEVEDAKKTGVHTLIWSNESFPGRCEKVFNVLEKLEQKYFQLRRIAYVRSYEKWAKSAYLQWGIKHKTYTGELIPFKKWFLTRTHGFYESFRPIIERSPDKITIRNMESVDDVVSDFLSFCNVQPDGIMISRVYESPKNIEVYLRSIFNNSFEEMVTPDVYDTTVACRMKIGSAPANFLQYLLPSKDDLVSVTEFYEKDKQLLNNFLEQKNEHILPAYIHSDTDLTIDLGVLIGCLSEIILSQNKQLELIANQLETVQKDIKELEGVFSSINTKLESEITDSVSPGKKVRRFFAKVIGR
jgi:hypothetical protein